jgi:signal peptidase I
LFIKRIVAGPGDVISISEGHVIRNGRREPDSFIRGCGGAAECNFPTPIKIASGHWFLLGDNRGESDDSRFWGPVPTSWITGIAGTAGVVPLVQNP